MFRRQHSRAKPTHGARRKGLLMADVDALKPPSRCSRFDNASRPKKLLSQLLKIISLLQEERKDEIDAAYHQEQHDLQVYEFNRISTLLVFGTS